MWSGEECYNLEGRENDMLPLKVKSWAHLYKWFDLMDKLPIAIDGGPTTIRTTLTRELAKDRRKAIENALKAGYNIIIGGKA